MPKNIYPEKKANYPEFKQGYPEFKTGWQLFEYGNNAEQRGFGGGGGIKYILGTTSNPVNTGNTLPIDYTYILNQSLPVDSKLTKLKIHAVSAGSCYVRIFQPIKGNGYSMLYNTLFNLSAGLNEFQLNVSLPKNSQIGVYNTIPIVSIKTDDVNMSTVSPVPLYAGYTNVSTSPTVTKNEMITYLPRNMLQIQAELTSNSKNNNQSHFDEDFSGGIMPANFSKSVGWNISEGKATGTSSNGFAYIERLFPIQNCKNTHEIEVKFTTNADILSIYRRPFGYGWGTYNGTIFSIDVAQNKINVHVDWEAALALPAVQQSKTLNTLTLTIGKIYVIKFKKNNKYFRLSITDVEAGITEIWDLDGYYSAPFGLGYGRAGLAVNNGTIEINKMKFYSDVINPKIAFFGDSITEGASVPVGTSFAERVEAVNPNIWICGHGGTRLYQQLPRIVHNFKEALPRYIVILAGTNDSRTELETTKWIENQQKIYDQVTSLKSIPIFCCVIPHGTPEYNARVQIMNAALLQKSWKIVRFDLAISLNNDGITYNSALMADAAHPNASGHALLFARLQMDAPELF